jgi:hypothetical protein
MTTRVVTPHRARECPAEPTLFCTGQKDSSQISQIMNWDNCESYGHGGGAPQGTGVPSLDPTSYHPAWVHHRAQPPRASSQSAERQQLLQGKASLTLPK